MSTLKRILLVLGGMVVVLAMVAGGMFLLGKPMTPQAALTLGAPAEPDETTPVATGAPATAADPVAPAPDSPLAIEVPGCVCHSDDPQLVAEHATYRMSQCFDCHGDGPSMGQ